MSGAHDGEAFRDLEVMAHFARNSNRLPPEGFNGLPTAEEVCSYGTLRKSASVAACLSDSPFLPSGDLVGTKCDMALEFCSWDTLIVTVLPSEHPEERLAAPEADYRGLPFPCLAFSSGNCSNIAAFSRVSILFLSNLSLNLLSTAPHIMWSRAIGTISKRGFALLSTRLQVSKKPMGRFTVSLNTLRHHIVLPSVVSVRLILSRKFSN